MKFQKFTILCTLLLSLIGFTAKAQTPVIGVQDAAVDCSGATPTLCMDLVLSTDVDFGCSSWVIDLSYNSAALTTSTSQVTINPVFNDGTTYVTSTTLDSPAPGRVLLSNYLNPPTAPFDITATPILLATVCFTITDQSAAPNFSIVNTETYVSDEAFATLIDATTAVDPNFPTSLACPGDPCDGVTIAANATAGATTCGNSNGTIITAPTGGATPYTTAISGGGTSGSLASGTYSVTVTDANGCTATQGGINVGASTNITVSASSTPNSSCATPNGTATAAVSGGVGVATYIWSNGATGASLTGLTAGTYSVTATQGGCTATASTTVNSSANAPSINLVSTTPNTCGAGNGGATVSASGGTGTITLVWSNGTNGTSISNVVGGTYTVTATDANSCTASLPVTIANQPAPAATATATNTSCGLNNGAIDVSIVGGTGTLTYTWTGSSATTQDLSGLAAGSYTVTVSDANNCTAVASATIASSTSASVSVMGSATTCGLNNGSAMAMPGGTAPFTYNWSNGATSQNVANLAPGDYSVTATDAGGCTAASTNFTVDGSTGAAASASATETDCGVSTGSVTVTATGTGTLSYTWTPNVSNTESATDLGAGTYNIVVTDANGCTAATSATVSTAGGPSNVASTTTNATCGNANGTITVGTVTGGVAPYSYSLDGGASQSTTTFSGIAAGAHVLTTTDDNGCSLNTNISVSNTAGPSAVSVSTIAGACGSSTGSVSANVTGGTGPFVYSWTLDGATIAGNAIITNQESGTYAVTVTDVNGCTAAGSGTLNCDAGVICDPANSAGVCQLSFVDNGGTIFTLITVPNGDGVAINYTSPGISNTAGYIAGFYICTDVLCSDIVAFFPSSTAQIDNPTAPLLPNVEYYVMTAIVLESNPFDIGAQCHQFGALSDETFLFEQGDICESTNITVSTQPYSCATGLQVSASGGVEPYSFSPPVGASLVNGTTNIVVIDANGCVGTGSITVTDAVVNAVADYDCADGLDVTITEGPAGATYTFEPELGTNGLANGSHEVTVTASNGCSTIVSFGVECIADPCDGVSVSGTASYDCDGGGLSVSGSGGTAPYTYSTANGSLLSNGTYTINIADANGCQGTTSVVVSCAGDPCDGVTVSGSAVYDCNGGGLTVSGSGGAEPYSYSLANGSQLANGNYTINITDANGCNGQATVTVNCSTECTTPPNAATIAYTGGALCNSALEGMSTVNLSALVVGDAGGTWSGQGGAASGTFDATGLAPAIYTLTYTVTAPGCPTASSTQSFTVADCNPAPIANADVSFVSTSATSITFDVTDNDTDLPVGCGIALVAINSVSAPGTLDGFEANGNVTININGSDQDIIVFYTIEDCVGQTAVGQWTINVTDCGANAGTITQPSHPKFCADDNVQFEHFGVAGGNYSLAYAVVDSEGNLAYYGPNVGTLPFNAAVPPISPAGSYQIYGVSYETALGLPAWPVPADACADVSEPINVNVFAPLETTTAYFCNGDGTIVFKVFIYGGAPSFYGNGSYLTNFTSLLGTTQWQSAGVIATQLEGYIGADAALFAIGNGAGVLTFNLPEDFFDGGDGFNLDVDSDGALCDDTWFITANIDCPPPPPCNPVPGEMDEANTVYVCAGDLATVQNIGAQFQDYDLDGEIDEIISYVLWDPTDSLSTVQISPDATFEFVPLACPSVYLAAAAVGPDGNNDGYVDWDDICTEFTPNAQPVVFLCPIEADWITICDEETGQYQVVIENVTGGLPQVVEGSNYTYSGSAGAGEFEAGIILGPFDSGTAFTIEIADANGCVLEDPIVGMEDCKITAVELLSFTGEVQETGNYLKWITASEIDNDYFTLLRSTDGVQFTAIATIDGAGNSNTTNSYAFMDKNAPAGLSYYRLDETDFNGKTATTGDVITLTRSEVQFGVVSASPVPTQNSVEIAFTTATTGNVVMNIFDAAGKLVNTNNINAINGINTTTIDLSNYASGVYFVQLNDGMQLITARIAKEQ